MFLINFFSDFFLKIVIYQFLDLQQILDKNSYTKGLQNLQEQGFC